LSGPHRAEQVVDIALRECRAGLLADFDRLVAFAAADSVRISFDLESAVGPKICRGVDKLARVEGDPGQAVIKAAGRHRLGNHHVGARVAREFYARFPAVAGHDQNRNCAVRIVLLAADGTCQGQAAVRRKPRVADQDIDLLIGEHLENTGAASCFQNLVAAKAAKHAVYQHGHVGARIGNEDHQVSKIDAEASHSPNSASGQSEPQKPDPKLSRRAE
jgi:hypothetical protein